MSGLQKDKRVLIEDTTKLEPVFFVFFSKMEQTKQKMPGRLQNSRKLKQRNRDGFFR